MDDLRAVALIRKDSRDQFLRERAAIRRCAKQSALNIVSELIEHDGIAILKSRVLRRAAIKLERHQASTLIVLSRNSLSNDSLVQAVGFIKFAQLGVNLIAVEGPPFPREMPVDDLVQVIGLASTFDALLRMPRQRVVSGIVRSSIGPNWRKQYVDLFPEAVHLAKDIYERSVRSGVRVTLREISAQLARKGHSKQNGKPFHPQEVDRMIKGPVPRLKR